MQCYSVIRHKMSRCQFLSFPSLLSFPVNLFPHPHRHSFSLSLFISLSRFYSSVIPQGDFPSFTGTAAFPALFWRASVWIRDENDADSRNKENQRRNWWCERGGDWWDYRAGLRDLQCCFRAQISEATDSHTNTTCTDRFIAVTSREWAFGHMLTWPLCFLFIRTCDKHSCQIKEKVFTTFSNIYHKYLGQSF